jgi:hypothetical protein
MAAKRGTGVPRKDGQPRESNVGTTKPVVDDSNWRVKVVARHRIKFDDVAKERYLVELARTGRRWAAEKAAGVARSTVDGHKKNDPQFAEACEEAAEAYATSGIMRIENDAIEGQLEVRYDPEGNVVSEVRRFETRLRELFLKKNDPAYNEKSHVELAGQVGVLVVAPIQSMSDWARMADAHDKASAESQNPDAADGPAIH